MPLPEERALFVEQVKAAANSLMSLFVQLLRLMFMIMDAQASAEGSLPTSEFHSVVGELNRQNGDAGKVDIPRVPDGIH